MTDAFVDRLGNVVIANGVARLDFLRVRAAEGSDRLEMEPALRVAMPLPELARMITLLEKLRGQLQQQAAQPPAGGASPS